MVKVLTCTCKFLNSAKVLQFISESSSERMKHQQKTSTEKLLNWAGYDFAPLSTPAGFAKSSGRWP